MATRDVSLNGGKAIDDRQLRRGIVAPIGTEFAMNDQSRRREGRLIAGLIVAGIGTIFLLRNMGYINIDEWWPLVLIIVGLALVISFFFSKQKAQ
jgi:hypothetical protein